ncbi:MAG: preprotein translocase subunit SecE [Sandaracinaceae bacterium]|nr:preprotein translocase subunit SecE [Sandaracinaceae bacterium]
MWTDPDRNVVLGSAAILGIVSAFALYKQKKVNSWAHEVAGELAKVTWPTRKETWYSTVVVIVTSLIAAAYLGAFDALWSAFTDLIYSVG